MNARTKKIKLTLSANASYEAENDMTPREFNKHVDAIASDFLKHGYMVQVVKGRSLEDHANAKRIFDVVESDWEPTGLKVTACVVHELVEGEILIRRWVDGTEVYLHLNHSLLGFNTNSNNGLPYGVKLSQLVPGTKLKVRFLDQSEDLTAVLIEREGAPKRSFSQLSADVLVQMQPGKFAKHSITLNQIVSIDDLVSL